LIKIKLYLGLDYGISGDHTVQLSFACDSRLVINYTCVILCF